MIANYPQLAFGFKSDMKTEKKLSASLSVYKVLIEYNEINA